MTNALRPILVLTCAVMLLAATAPAFAGVFRTGRILAFATETWRIWTPAGDTRVVVDGDGDTDLDCWVYDRFGTLLGRDVDGTDLCIVRFHNQSSGELTIRIRNFGDVYNDYQLTID
ncbi:MAG TPA: hypothetical protein VJ691_00925 [Vicinamibacterales bacterium]|nr:hypothetical protein [Vicinamibacterales bacterium]